MRKVTIVSIIFILILVAAIVMIVGDMRSKGEEFVPAPPTTTIPPAENTKLANPASVNCEKQGGTTVIQTLPTGGQYGLCEFEDNMACEEWAMMRGDCPVGGVKTTGYTTDAQKYCVWSGGKTTATTNATCTFPNGIVCPVNDFYNGTCSSTEPNPNSQT